MVPHALANNGQHVRAFDRTHQVFSDFVVTRIKATAPVSREPRFNETQVKDSQWDNMITLVRIPHPSLQKRLRCQTSY